MKLTNSKITAQQKDINIQLRQIRKQKYVRNMQQKKIFEHLVKNNLQLDLKKPQQVKILVNGIPQIYRQVVWPQLLKNTHGVTIKLYQMLLKKVLKTQIQIQQQDKNQQLQPINLIKAKSQGYVPSQQLNLQIQKLSRWFETIRMDIPRTFSQLKIFQTLVKSNVNQLNQTFNSAYTHEDTTVSSDSININHNQSRSLFNILSSWVIYREDIGYKQGMSQIAAYLLIQLNDQLKAFQIFCSIITTDVLYQFFTMNLQYISGFCRKIAFRLRQRHQQLHEFFEQNEVDYKLFILDWIYSLFTKCFELDMVGKVWDLLLLNTIQEKIIVNLIVQIIAAFQQQILNYRRNEDQVDAMEVCRYLKKIKIDQIREELILEHLKTNKN